jgi:hypothetical protein
MKKAQAALEFLTTYGWAFLVILVMIGALAYFGVLNPKNFLPSRCTFSPEVSCIESKIMSTTPHVSFRVRNDVGSTADFNSSITYIGGVNPTVWCTIGGGANYNVSLAPGRVAEFTCTFASTTLPKEDKAKFEVLINYKKGDGLYWIPLKGEIYGTIS